MKTSSITTALIFGLITFDFASAQEELGERPVEQSANPRVRRVSPDGPLAGVWEKRRSYLRGRIFHSAIWTYSEMIVWGGGSEHQFYNDGGIYDPTTDQWKPVSLTNAPSGRWGHAAVWTGREMIVSLGAEWNTAGFRLG